MALSLLLATTAQAAPPAGTPPNPAISAWVQSLLNAEGKGCCSEADCRRTAIELGADGRLWAWIGREQFGDGAPDAWHVVPVEEIKSRQDRPKGVSGAIICWYMQRVYCADLEIGG